MSLIKEIQKDLINKNYFEQFEEEFVNHLMQKYEGEYFKDKMTEYYKIKQSKIVKEKFETIFNIQQNTKFKIFFENNDRGNRDCANNYRNYNIIWDYKENEALIELKLDKLSYHIAHLHFEDDDFYWISDNGVYYVKEIIQIE